MTTEASVATAGTVGATAAAGIASGAAGPPAGAGDVAGPSCAFGLWTEATVMCIDLPSRRGARSITP
jgi:hypothetical protein